jgi:hypothetical protein
LDAARAIGVETVVVYDSASRDHNSVVRAFTGKLFKLTQPKQDGLSAEQRAGK